MISNSATAHEAARRVWARATEGTGAGHEMDQAAERMFAQLSSGLGRWIGADGYRVLFGRAMGLTRAEHPVLSGFSFLRDNGSSPPATLTPHKPADIATGMVALMATLIDLLGRIVGEEMAVRLVEQTETPSPRGVVSMKSDGGRNG